jgi:DNA-binding ferritin-like protein (Dps family)
MAVEWISQKRRYRHYQARMTKLPADYRATVEALERYLTYSGAIVKGDVLVSMLEDLADLFEQSAADGTPIRAIVGDDPVEFADTFVSNYADGQWINKERDRLINAIDHIVGDEQ